MKSFRLVAQTALLLIVCGCAEDIGIRITGESGHKEYNTESIFINGISSDTTNLLGNYLLMDMFQDDPKNFVVTLESLLHTDRTQEVRIALAETGLLLADRFHD